MRPAAPAHSNAERPSSAARLSAGSSGTCVVFRTYEHMFAHETEHMNACCSSCEMHTFRQARECQREAKICQAAREPGGKEAFSIVAFEISAESLPCPGTGHPWTWRGHCRRRRCRRGTPLLLPLAPAVRIELSRPCSCQRMLRPAAANLLLAAGLRCVPQVGHPVRLVCHEDRFQSFSTWMEQHWLRFLMRLLQGVCLKFRGSQTCAPPALAPPGAALPTLAQ